MNRFLRTVFQGYVPWLLLLLIAVAGVPAASTVFELLEHDLLTLVAGDRSAEVLLGRNGLIGESSPQWTRDRIHGLVLGTLQWLQVFLVGTGLVGMWATCLRRSNHRRRTVAATVIVACVAIGSFVGLGTWAPRARDHRRQAAELLARSEKVGAMVRESTPHERLRNLPANRFSGPVHNLTDAMSSARITGNHDHADPVIDGLRVDFDGEDPISFSGTGARPDERAGVMRLPVTIDGRLASVEPLDLGSSRGSIMDIRLRSESGGTIALLWSPDGEADFDSEGIVRYEQPVIPGPEYQTYRIDLSTVCHTIFSSGQRIERFLIDPSTIESGVVEIDWIQISSLAAKYADAAATVSYETLEREMRKVIAVRPPAQISFDLEIPVADPRLRFATGVPLDDGAVEFLIWVGTGTDRTLVYRGHRGLTDGWVDSTVDLDEFAGRSIRLTLETRGDPSVAFWAHPILHGTPPRPTRVVIILEDALRGDHLSSWGYHRHTSPFRDQFFSRGVRFRFAVSQATATRPSVPSFMTSLLPTATGVWSLSDRLGERWVTLAEVLSSQGFLTASFVQNSNAGPLAGLHQGFDQILDAGSSTSLETETAATLEAWIETHRDQNFLLYVHILDPHGPYDPPKAMLDRFPPDAARPKPQAWHAHLDPEWATEVSRAERISRYDAEIRNNDDGIARLLTSVDDLGLSDDTLVIHMADHGEHLGEHGDLWIHHPPGYRQTVHVPFQIVFPREITVAREVRGPVALLDMMPTVLDLVGIDPTTLPFHGRSLAGFLKGSSNDLPDDRLVVSLEVTGKSTSDVLTYGSIYTGDRHHLVTKFPRDPLARVLRKAAPSAVHTLGFPRTFDLESDFDEMRPLDPSSWLAGRRALHTLRRLERRDRVVLDALDDHGERSDPVYDAKAIEELKVLGYIVD